MLKAGRAAGIGLFAVLVLAACTSGGGVRPLHGGHPDADAAAIQAHYRSTPAADASLALRIKPGTGDALNIQLHLWCAADGRVRLAASKLDVEFCSALIRPDGAYTVVAPRAHLAATGTFTDQDRAGLSPFLTRPALIADELRSGPLPIVPPLFWSEGDDGAKPTLTAPNADLSATGATTVATWDPATTLVTTKDLCVGDDVIAIAYSHEKDFDGLLRPTLAQITAPAVPNAQQTVTTITIGLKHFDGLGDISAERMHLDVPADARTVPLDDLLKHLGD